MGNKSKIHTVYKTAEGKRVPSVTSVLKILAKPALIHWAWNLGCKGIDYRKYRDDKADIGSLAHRMILCHLKNEKCEMDEYSKDQIDKAENCFLKYLEWERHHKIEPILVEHPLVSEIWEFGGTPDFYGLINGVYCLMDFKTGKDIYPEYFYQLAGYDLLLRNYQRPKYYRILNIGRDETEKFKEEIKEDIKIEGRIFLHCLRIYELLKIQKDGNKE